MFVNRLVTPEDSVLGSANEIPKVRAPFWGHLPGTSHCSVLNKYWMER